MQCLKVMFLGSLFCLTISGCSDSTIDKIEAAKDKVCACKDKACARAVSKESKHLREQAKDMMNEDKLKAMKFAEQAKSCMAKLSS